jgi:RNA polymerase sigma-70 factor (ECF subfamily)
VPLTSLREPDPPVSPTTKNDSEPSDVRVLVARLQNGDASAFEAIYLRFRPRIWGVVRSRVNDRHLAEDLVSETFTKAFAAASTLRWVGDRQIESWLVTIARNLVADHYGAAPTRLVTTSPEAGAELIDKAALENTVVGRTNLLSLLEQLGPRHREVVVHRILLDRTVEETAAELGCHVSTVKHALRDALRRLAVALQPVEVAAA